MLLINERSHKQSYKYRYKGDAENARPENAGLENAETALYGTPCIPYVCLVLQNATIEYV